MLLLARPFDLRQQSAFVGGAAIAAQQRSRSAIAGSGCQKLEEFDPKFALLRIPDQTPTWQGCHLSPPNYLLNSIPGCCLVCTVASGWRSEPGFWHCRGRPGAGHLPVSEACPSTPGLDPHRAAAADKREGSVKILSYKPLYRHQPACVLNGGSCGRGLPGSRVDAPAASFPRYRSSAHRGWRRKHTNLPFNSADSHAAPGLAVFTQDRVNRVNLHRCLTSFGRRAA